VRTKNLTATGIAKKFVEAINAHDVDGLARVMSSDHVLVDSLGNRFQQPLCERDGSGHNSARLLDRGQSNRLRWGRDFSMRQRRRDVHTERWDDETLQQMEDSGRVASTYQEREGG
jgi:hypothetical protein